MSTSMIGATPIANRPAVKRVIETAAILNAGWEMDNTGWLVELEDGSLAALTTSHGHLQEWVIPEMIESLEELKRSENSISKILEGLKN